MTMSTQGDFQAFAGDRHQQMDSTSDGHNPPLPVQILSIIGFGVFSIVGVALAFDAHWIAGLVVAAIITSTWAGNRTFGGKGFSKKARAQKVASVVPNIATKTTSGNASFDAYREDMLARLEQESRDFDAFLARLREARDSSEFDQFMKDRVAAAKHAETAPDA